VADRRQGRPIYLAIIWHQHQPLYVDARHDCLIAPWVRTHATKDYYDMAATLEQFPDVHCTINLTVSLLKQLQEYYIDRLGNCIYLNTGAVDMKRFRRDVEGRTDPWIDLLLKPAGQFDELDRDFLYRNSWSALSTNEVMLERFPEYEKLKFRLRNNEYEPTVEELRELKFWFFLAHFDPDFLNGPCHLPTGDVCDLSVFVTKKEGKYYLPRPVTEDDCQRILVEAYKVFINIIPVHKNLQYNPDSQSGQIELVTTPYTHPILPLIHDSDVARICQPHSPMPQRFSFPQDAEMHIKKALVYYRNLFGHSAVGMWPAEGSVSYDVVPLFARNGIRWIATDKQILDRSAPSGSHLFPYRIVTEWSDVAILFRDTHLSDKIGFTYQTMRPEEAVNDFINSVMGLGVQDGERDKLVTVILDGENAWEWYRFDHDGKRFLHLLYKRLSELFLNRTIVTVTPTEFLLGNHRRGVPPHPLTEFTKIDRLWSGSWIHANFDTWIGDEEENKAWNYLLEARRDLERAAIPAPSPDAAVPREGVREWYAYKAWEELYAAEGSDWFWWYGEDQDSSGSKPFDIMYLTHLKNIYYYAKRYGAQIKEPPFDEVILEKPASKLRRVRRAMAKGERDIVSVLFCCKVPDSLHLDAVYIVGNREELGEWVPNKIRMYDDGTHGDEQAGDRVWSVMIDLPRNSEIHYKYTHSGREGFWEGDEYQGKHRTVIVQDSDRMVVEDEFGKIDLR
jgi:alpha-amylase/alpha-mannosidase (GH57 family)